jgi:glycosyltransferase involved in cell wall biosynthesis
VVVIPQRKTSDTVGQMPAKIFDAMAMAKPIVSTRVSDIPEVLGDTGYLVDPGDVEQLASAINHVFSHPEEARLKGKQARERCIGVLVAH